MYRDLWRPHNLLSFVQNQYEALLFNKFRWKSWVFSICLKNMFFDVFKSWLKKVEIKTQCKLKCLRIDKGKKFISLALKEFCKSRGIIFGYVLLYTHKKNGLAEKYWRTLYIIKDTMLIDSNLANIFWIDTMNTANYLQNWLQTSHISNRKTVIIPKKNGLERNKMLVVSDFLIVLLI